MDYIVAHFDLVLVVLGSLLGSVKASWEFEKEQHCFARFLDISLGVFIGVTVAYNYGSEWSIWLEGLVALIGGVSGTMIVEVFMQLLPGILREAIQKFIKSKLP